MATILVVEDDRAVSDVLVAALAQEHLVKASATCARALGILRSEQIDVVLLDMVLPDGDGFAVLSAATALRPSPSVVILTVLDAIPKAVKAIQLGASDYLVKPCTLEQLRTSIDDVLSIQHPCCRQNGAATS